MNDPENQEQSTGQSTGQSVEPVIEKDAMPVAATEGPGDIGDAEVKKPSNWSGWLIFLLGTGAALWGLFAPLGSGWGLWNWRSGLTGVMYSVILALFTILLGILIGWILKRKGSNAPRALRWLGLAIALLYSGWMLNWFMAARSVPAIHDISTDLADPPQFQSLTVRADNMDNIPGADDPEMKGLNPQQRWRTLHQQAYGDIRAVRIEQRVGEVISKAERLAKARGWEVIMALPAEGRMEATATTAMFRFKDDVVLRVRPTETGTGSIVDMRSVSRVGQSDIGTNARRIREFLADLSGTVTAG